MLLRDPRTIARELQALLPTNFDAEGRETETDLAREEEARTHEVCLREAYLPTGVAPTQEGCLKEAHLLTDCHVEAAAAAKDKEALHKEPKVVAFKSWTHVNIVCPLFWKILPLSPNPSGKDAGWRHPACI